jgi:hypothetical protein
MRGYALQLRDTTDLLYSSARDRGQRAMLWGTLTGRSRCLLALEEIRQGCHVSTTERSRLGAGTRLVPIAQIVGSEGRCADFDRDFNPLHDHNRGRWLRIAAAQRRGTPLPPVDLVQVGDLYFVLDGHHRISVARALGQPDIEARVTVWHVRGPLPWETQPRPCTQGPSTQGPSKQGLSKPFGPETLVRRLYHEILTYVRGLQPDQSDGALTGGSQG